MCSMHKLFARTVDPTDQHVEKMLCSTTLGFKIFYIHT